MRTLCCAALAATLALLSACGETAPAAPDAGPAASVGFVYQDPQSDGWRLLKNADSTATHLVLDLVGPSGEKGRGIGFNLQSDGSVAFAHLGQAGYVRDTGVFKLQSTFANYPVEPVLLAGGLKKGGTLLTVGIFQKDRLQPAQALGQAVLRIALDFDPVKTAALLPGTSIPLVITKAKAVPEEIGTMPADPSSPSAAAWASVMNAYATSLVPVRISVGALQTR